jgi:hypothetical protein
MILAGRDACERTWLRKPVIADSILWYDRRRVRCSLPVG